MVEKYLDGERFLSETQRQARRTRQALSQMVSAETLRNLSELERLANETRQLIVRDALLQAA